MSGAGDTETVVVVRPPGRTRYGDPAPGATVEFDLPGCLFAPGASQEGGLGSNQVRIDATVYAPAGTVVYATDRIRARDMEYSVIGFPQVWGRSGVVIELRRITG